MTLPSTNVRTSIARPSGLRLDAAVVVLSWLLVAGVAADFRAHAVIGRSFEEEGFFTPEHVFFYAAFVGIALLVGAATYANRRRGASWAGAVPPGYGWAVVGVLVFGFGGVGDFFWHRAFGFEQGFETLTSPSHLALAVGAVLFLASPLRAALVRAERPSGVWALPATVAASLALTVIALFGGYLNPLVQSWAVPIYEMSNPRRQATLVSLLAFPTLFVGTALVLDRAASLPPGALTLLGVHPGIASVVGGGHLQLFLTVLVVGAVADVCYQLGAPLCEHPRFLRLFGVAVPASFAAAYFAVLEVTDGITWSIHVWAGAIVLAGAAGLLLTYVVLPISPHATAGDRA